MFFGIGCDIAALKNKGKLILGGNLLHKFGIVDSIRAQLVVKMRHDEGITLFVKCAKQTQAIRTTGDGDDERQIGRKRESICQN